MKPLAEELLAVTGVESLSSLVSVLLTRYGNHLKQSWVLPVGMPQMPIPQAIEVTSPVTSPSTYIDAQPQPEPEPDPVITRLAGLIENF